MADEVLYQVDGRVATFTLNRPDQRNAVNPAVTAALGAHMDNFEADDEVWVGILTGAGDIAFSAGADLKAISAGGAGGISGGKGGFGGFVNYPRTKPVIAAVNGFALAEAANSSSPATSSSPRSRRSSGCPRCHAGSWPRPVACSGFPAPSRPRRPWS
jgi:enoyl-CoA hydratase/carnithine racemase